MKKVLSILPLLMLSLQLFAGSETGSDAILGIWKNGTGKGYIEIYKSNGKFHGRIYWINESLITNVKSCGNSIKPHVGMVMLRDLIFDGEEYNSGSLFNPGDGKEYKCLLKMKDFNTLNVRGFIGFSFIGKSDVWERVNDLQLTKNLSSKANNY